MKNIYNQFKYYYKRITSIKKGRWNKKTKMKTKTHIELKLTKKFKLKKKMRRLQKKATKRISLARTAGNYLLPLTIIAQET